jgi:phosphatidylglycerophosphate synthase
MSVENRRPIQARSLGIMRTLATMLARSNITPNQISCASVVMALIVPAALFWQGITWAGCLLAVLGIQLRLVCNLIDGMVAVEGGKRSVLGDIYNEFPDRIADTIIILGFAYFVAQDGELGWAAAFFAVLTAYTRNLGAALGTKHYYVGPMAKQHRMALLSIVLLYIPLAEQLGRPSIELAKSILWVISVSAILTTGRRLVLIARELKARNPIK